MQSPNSYFMDVKCPGKCVDVWGFARSVPCLLVTNYHNPMFLISFTHILPFPGLPLSGCYKITTVFSHAQTVVLCVSCSTVLCQPTGGRARLTEGDVTCPCGRVVCYRRCFLYFQAVLFGESQTKSVLFRL